MIVPQSANPLHKRTETLKIGIASMVTPVDTVRYYQEIVEYLQEQIGIPLEMVHRKTYGEMDRLLEKGVVKVAFICSAPYVRNKERSGIDLLVAPSVNGKSIYHSYIIVHKDSGINSIKDLKGKTFAFVDPGSNSGRLYPVYLLKKMGYEPEGFFSKVIYSYSHNKSVEMVAKRIVDGAAVESLVFEYMLKSGSPYVMQTKVIKRSPPFAIPPVVVKNDINSELKARLKNAFLNMHMSERGRQILKSMMIDRFVEISDSEYDSIRRMEQFVKEGEKNTGKGSGRKTIYFSVIPRDNPRIIFERYQPLLDYLMEKTPYRYELVLKRTYEDTVRAIGTGQIDIAFLGPLTYLEAKKLYGAICILRPKGSNGKGTYRSVIIKRKDLEVKDLSEAKGMSFAFSTAKSTSGNLIPRYMLASVGIHLNELKFYKNFDYHDSVVKAVLKGEYDAGAVRDSVANKYLKLGIDIIAVSEDIPTGPLVAGPNIAFTVVEHIKMALIDLKPDDPDSERILSKLDDDLKNGFMKAEHRDYEKIRRKINDVPEGCGKGCHPRIKL